MQHTSECTLAAASGSEWAADAGLHPAHQPPDASKDGDMRLAPPGWKSALGCTSDHTTSPPDTHDTNKQQLTQALDEPPTAGKCLVMSSLAAGGIRKASLFPLLAGGGRRRDVVTHI